MASHSRAPWRSTAALAAVWLTAAATAPAQEPPAAPKIAARRQSSYADLFDHGIYGPLTWPLRVGDRLQEVLHAIPQAGDVTASGEVPDSAWFVNRNGVAPLSPTAIAAGPEPGAGPDPAAGPWTVRSLKSVGRTPGMLIRGADGQDYFLKFDGSDTLGLASGAEVISGRLVHAIGYHVPHYVIVNVPPQILRMAPDATYVDRYGRRRALSPEVLQGLLERVAANPDGTRRASASRRLPGIPKGPFSFNSRRTDDPLDSIPHRDLRVLRALRVFAAWLNHHDIQGNGLDLVHYDGERWVMTHYLIDFGSTLGSDNEVPKYPNQGHSYVLDVGQTIGQILTLGLAPTPWAARTTVRYPSVGYFTSEGFDPRRWKPMYMNRAFERMTDEDARWAARIVGSFTDEQLRAAVDAGQLPEPGAAEALTRVLIERRDAVLRAWLGVSPSQTP
jgi:hypothetical protein